MTFLVCFTKERDDRTVADRQYHVFTKCLNNIEFVHDNIFKAFTEKGYTWSAVPFPLELAYNCDFTVTNCCE